MYALSTGQQTDRFQASAAAGEQPQTIEALFDRQAICQIDAGATLFHEGDKATHLFEVVEGVLRIVKIFGDGRRVITGFLHPGDLVGVSLKDRYLYSAEAVTHARFRRFGRREFQEAINASPSLRPLLFARLCDEMAVAQNQMVLLSRKNAEERMCSFLLAELHREQRAERAAATVELPMTRLDIADYLGLTIETVSRMITRLTRAGVISPVGRHSLRILKASALSRLAGDEEECEDCAPLVSMYG
jgi:CRP/FNR family transcriptional regulator, anaerobic regulatory protein